MANTSAVDINTQAVSPGSIFGAAAGVLVAAAVPPGSEIPLGADGGCAS